MLLFCVWALLGACPGWAEDQDIGGLRKVKGSASIERTGQVMAAKPGMPIRQNDVLVTGPDGSLGVIFKDNTTISLGPDSRLVVSEFVFKPEQKEFSFIIKMIKGTASYLTGIIGKLSPESVKFKTPKATVGIRGTKFLVKVDPD
jgi:hypothetical protein